MPILTRHWVRQPPTVCKPNWKNPVTTGLRRLIDARDYRIDLAEGAPVTFLSGGTLEEAPRIGKQGFGIRTLVTANNIQVTVPSWTNVTSEGSALLVFDGAAGNYNGWEIGDTGQTDHFPFSGGGYTDAFWSSRWLNNIAAPSGESFSTSEIRILVTVRNGRQRAYWNGKLWHSNTLTGGFTLPANLLLFCRGSERLMYLAAVWDRALSDLEAENLSFNPWQLFDPHRIYVPFTASGGGNTYTFSVSGGIQFSGTAPQLHERILVPSGGVTFGGTAPITDTNEYQFAVSGGVQFSGTNEMIREKIVAPSGGVTFAGSAPMVFIPAGGVGTNNADRISVGVSRKVGVS